MPYLLLTPAPFSSSVLLFSVTISQEEEIKRKINSFSMSLQDSLVLGPNWIAKKINKKCTVEKYIQKQVFIKILLFSYTSGLFLEGNKTS